MQGSYYVHPGRICYTKEMKKKDYNRLNRQYCLEAPSGQVEIAEKDRRQLIKTCHFGHINRMGGLKALLSDLV